MIDICVKYRIGFNYHSYHEQSFGFYGNTDSLLPDNKNTALEKLFAEKLRQ